jgi:hypothetical protein
VFGGTGAVHGLGIVEARETIKVPVECGVHSSLMSVSTCDQMNLTAEEFSPPATTGASQEDDREPSSQDGVGYPTAFVIEEITEVGVRHS